MTDTSRRDVLTSATALGFASPMLGLPLAARAAATVDLNDAQHRMPALMKIYGATDDRVCFGFVNGTYYGLIDQQATPLFGVMAAVFNRFVARPDGTYDGATFEVAYFTDLKTGEKLEKFTNPLTGETLTDIPVTRSGPHPMLITPNKAERVHVAGSNREVNQRFLPFRVVNDDVWLTEEMSARFTSPGSPPRGNVSITTYSAKVSEVLDPKRKSVAANVSYTATTPWRPWLKMGDRPGLLLGNATGRTVHSIDELLPYYLTLTKKLHPDVLEDPMALLKTVKTG